MSGAGLGSRGSVGASAAHSADVTCFFKFHPAFDLSSNLMFSLLHLISVSQGLGASMRSDFHRVHPQPGMKALGHACTSGCSSDSCLPLTGLQFLYL